MFLAVVAALVSGGNNWWLPLHLFLVGGLLSAVSTTTQKLAVTWSSSPTPSDVWVGIQRWSLAVGALSMVSGHEIKQDWLFAFGAIVVGCSLVMLMGLLFWIRSKAGTQRYVPAIDAYLVAIFCGLVGVTIGSLLGLGFFAQHYSQLRAAHFLLNLFGLIGLVIAGTLPYFVATQIRSKMSPIATTFVKRLSIFVLACGVGVAVVGDIVSRRSFVGFGLYIYCAGLVFVVLLLPYNKRSYKRYLRPRALQLLTGIFWWIAMTGVLGFVQSNASEDRHVLQALVVGGFAQILVASLAYLGPVIRGGGHELLAAGFVTTRSWVSLVSGNLAAVFSFLEQNRIVGVCLLVWLIDSCVRYAILIKTKSAPEGMQFKDNA